MSRKFLVPIDLNTNELQNAVIGASSGDPTGVSGRIYYNNLTPTAGVLKVYNGTTWQTIATGGSSVYVGTTQFTIGNSSGSVTTLAGMTSITSTTFVGALTGNADTATSATTAAALSPGANINGVGFTGASPITVTANTTNDLTVSTGLQFNSGTTFNGGTAKTITIDSTVVTLSGSQTLTNKTFTTPTIQSGGAVFQGTSGTITLVANATAGTNTLTLPASTGTLATTGYVDTSIANSQAGFNVHTAALVASTTNITGTYTNGTSDNSQGTGVGATFVFTTAQIDGVTLAANNRVLLKNQTDQKQNGIYTVTGTPGANVTLTRATDFDNSVAGEVFPGDLVYVSSGTVNGGSTWAMNSVGTATTPTNAIKIGTDNIVWAQFAGTTGGVLSVPNGGTGASSFTSGALLKGAGASAITVASGTDITTAIGANAVTLATNASNITIADDTTTNSALYPLFTSTVTAAGNVAARVSSTKLSYNPSTGYVTASGFTGSGNTITSLNASNVASGTLPGARGVSAGNTTASFVTYNGTTPVAGQFDGSTTYPTGTTRLNYSGNFVSNVVTTRSITGTIGGSSAALNITNDSVISVSTANSSFATQNINITTGNSSTTGGSASAGNIVLTGGNLTGASTSGSPAGSTYIIGGSATNGYGGSLFVTTGAGSNGRGAVVLDAAGTSPTATAGAVTVGGNIYLPTTGTSGLLKLGAIGLVSTALAGSDYVVSVTGTSNQITVAGSSGVLTLSTPQNIHTTATPQFAGIGLGTTAPAAGITVSGGKITAAAGVAGYASLLITAGAADPTSPVSGDVWNNAGVLKFRDASSVSQVVALAGAAGTTLNSTITFSSLTRVAPLSSGTAGYVKVDASGNLTSVAETNTKKYTALTTVTYADGARTWSIPASTHGLGANAALLVQVYDTTSPSNSMSQVETDVYINTTGTGGAVGDVTISWTQSGGTAAIGAYRVVIIG